MSHRKARSQLAAAVAVVVVEWAVAASVVATGAATILSWVGNRYWTYRHQRRSNAGHELGLFLVVNVIGIVITLSSGAQASAGSAAGAPAGAGFDTVVVEEGDSLWSIAQSVSGGQDTRDVVLDIVEVNGLDRQVVHPGQELAVPGR